ncbi:ESCO1/2 acetyl-transferase-domain-containing protein [Dissophora ornata]|nr:ESCO1/2 acetyl-transferase-domain-containing protein [Dissophora ornata]
MNTPASSSLSNTSSGSDAGLPSPSPPRTPNREYKSHRTIKNTYGRAKPSTDLPSSPDPWSNYSTTHSSASPSSSPFQPRRSRLSGSFVDLAPWNTPSRGTRTLTEKLERAKLDLDSDSDVDNADGGGEGNEKKKYKDQDQDQDQVEDMDEETMAARAMSPSHTPLKRRRRSIVMNVALPVRSSPRAKKTLTGTRETTVQDQDQEAEGLEGSRRGSSSQLSPRSSSPSPPASPSERSFSNKKSRVGTSPATLLSLSTAKSRTLSSDTSVNTIATEKRRTKQATLSSFFSPKAGKGTGILKGRADSSTSSNSSGSTADKDVTVSTGNNNTATATTTNTTTAGSISAKKSSEQEPPKKLEQLFLAFSKDRTKSPTTKPSTLATSSASIGSNSTLSTRKPAKTTSQLQREDEKSKRYHCPQCGMPYVRGQPEDEQIHDRYHRAVLGGIDFPGYKNEVVVARYNDFENSERHHVAASNSGNKSLNGGGELSYSRIVMVSMSDAGRSTSTSATTMTGGSSFEKRKVKEVLKLVNKELGSVDFDPEQLDSCKVFLYISGKKKVIGCVIAERIKKGFEILSLSPSDASTDDSVPPTNTPGATAANTMEAAAPDHGGSAIFCSTVAQPAICGINRIWVSTLYRRQKIASRLLDAVRDRFIYACKLEMSDLAFSQPTGDGKALASQYLGTDKFLVYVE